MSSRKPRRWVRRLVVTLIVLAVLAVAADRAAAWAAENRLASMAEQQAARYDLTAQDTSVQIGGFGFLPQVAKEEFKSVTMTMTKPTFSEVPGENLEVKMTGVHVPRAVITGGSGASVTVDNTDIRLALSPAEVAKLAARGTGLSGLKLEAVDGKLRAKLSVGEFAVDVAVTPTAKNGRVALAVDEISSDVPAVARDLLKSRLARGISLPKLPYDATLKEVAVEGGNVILIATAANLKLST
ncbi:DUF2993 domain-containing protein [Kribbella albertanoniae]|uniref:DUF2993 domain-containing protein n=1 Tax=Kribbella albertanoniae TaxID=1266829 RepID=A0A4R4Q4L5_9ACTN|nr:DUF2993 domain-containing protein [Kribbella albertanoniae]TDC30018.1 DUF2993 domain-containing protein [Kribbella albertanoniae]